jgi:hypothetical protein
MQWWLFTDGDFLQMVTFYRWWLFTVVTFYFQLGVSNYFQKQCLTISVVPKNDMAGIVVGFQPLAILVKRTAPPTPFVRHSPECTCCDFGHLGFFNMVFIIYGHMEGTLYMLEGIVQFRQLCNSLGNSTMGRQLCNSLGNCTIP